MEHLFELHPCGLFLRSEALDLGYSDRDIKDGLHGNLLHKVRVGSYVAKDRWLTASPEERHDIRASAVLLRHDNRVALSHVSGSVRHGLRLLKPDLRLVHVTQLDGGPSRALGDVVYHSPAWEPEDVMYDGEHLVMSPVQCAYGTAATIDSEGGLVVLDSLLDLDLASQDDAENMFDVVMRHWPGTGRLRIAHNLSSPGSESAGESRVVFLCWRERLPMPTKQIRIYRDGILIARVDFGWQEDKTYGEFDGRIKYGRLLKPGQDPGEVVFAEKQREDAVREETGGVMVRIIWADFDQPKATGDRIRTQLRRGRAA